MRPSSYPFQFFAARLLRLLMLTLALLISGCEQTSSRADAPHKPSHPLQLLLQPLGDVTPGENASFEVVLSSLFAINEAQIEVTLPTGVRRHEGALQWRGSLAAGQPQRLHFSILVPEDGEHRITATANAQRNGQRLSRTSVYVVGAGQGAPARASGVVSPSTPTSGGQPVIEYELR